jgi:hypothetical protein
MITLALALAAPSAMAAPPTSIDMMEHVFGASNVNAVAGHGALTAGISADGDLTVLSWPGPSFADHLAYLSGNDLDVRERPHFGAHDGMGSYLGLLVTTASGTDLVWLRGPRFSHTQRYTQPDAPVPETRFASEELGLVVVLTDVVSPDADVLTRRVVVARGAGSPVTGVSLVLYENLSPTLSRAAQLPFADWALDSRNDFVALWDPSARAVVHLHPSDRALVRSIADLGAKPEEVGYGPIDALMRKAPSDAEVDALLGSIDSTLRPGVAALVTTEPPPEAFQVGSDATALCAQVGRLVDNVKALPAAFPGLTMPLDPAIADALRCVDPLPAVRSARGWTWAPEDALADLADRALSGSRLAACQTNAAMIAPLAFSGGQAQGAAVFAFGATVAQARAALSKAASVPAAARQSAAEQAAHAALGSARLPDPALGQRVVDVARRSLANLYVARERSTGAIVAGISRQPPYFLDWPRDGAFFSQGLDVAGLLPWASQRAVWYASLQRRAPAQPSVLLGQVAPDDPDTQERQFPAFAWEMNYYADGTIGGNIRFEIDNTALHVWAVTAHAASLPAAERGPFVQAVWPTTRDALELLSRWRDAATGLPAPANEDDHLELTSTLHGATTVYAALGAGVWLARAAGDEAEARALLDRATQLRSAIMTVYYDPKSGLFRDARQTGTDYNPGSAGGGSTAWLAWPARLLDPSDPRLEAQLTADMTAVMKHVRGETEGSAYVLKNVVSAALLGSSTGSRAMAREAVLALADSATADTMHFGEVFVATHPEGAPRPVMSQRVAQPHVWEGMLFYLAAMALTSPERFDAHVERKGGAASPPKAQPAVPSDAVGGGCGCREAGKSTGTAMLGGAWTALVLGGAAWLRGTRRRCGAGRQGERGASSRADSRGLLAGGSR